MKYHFAYAVDSKGNVKPLCRDTRIRIGNESWALRIDAVTCKKCLDILENDPPPKSWVGPVDWDLLRERGLT